MSVECVWPGPLPNLDGWPALYVTVTTPADQAELHRQLGRAGYTATLVDETDRSNRWRFVHPDGERP